MKIQEAKLCLSSQHEYDYRQEVETHSRQSFRTLFGELSGVEGSDAAGEGARLARMLNSLVAAILAAMEGKKCRSGLADGADSPRPPAGKARELAWRTETSETVSEHERTQVAGSGVVRAADGREIAFDLKVDLCRDYRYEQKFAASGKAILHDPLVINFAGPAAELTQERFDFDLDADGRSEGLPGLGSGSGYIVLDRDGNGRANDGSELFGARSGAGFAELAALDADGNGWLDEADPAFADLRIWSGGQSANALASLKEKGVGALWLGAVDSPFAVKDEANRLLGVIRASGLYLHENGRAGSLQQIDLAVEPGEKPASV